MKRTTSGRGIVRRGGIGFLAALLLAPPAWTVWTTGTPSARAAAGAGHTRVDVYDSLTRLVPDLHFQEAWLQDVVDYLRNFGAMTVVVEWQRLAEFKVEPDTPVTIRGKNISVEDALKRLMGQLGDAKHRPAFAQVGDVIVISTPAGLQAQLGAAKALADAKPNPEMKKLLNQELPDANFQGVGLSESIDFVKDATKVPAEVDWKALKEAGVDRKAPITANLTGLPAGQALCLIIASVDSKKPLGVTIDGEKVRVGLLPAAAPPPAPQK